MATKPKTAAKAKTRKSQRDVSDSNLHKRLMSDRISDDVDAFEKAGGRVEVLGTTRVLQKIGDMSVQDAPAKAVPAKVKSAK